MITRKLKKCSVCDVSSVLWKANPPMCKDCYQRHKNSLTQTTDGKVAKPFKYRTTEIRKISDKQKKLNVAYLAQRAVYLKNNPFCKVGIEGCMGKATQVHHKKSRGQYLLQDSTWLPICAYCHHQVETRPQWAKENGFSLSRLENI